MQAPRDTGESAGVPPVDDAPGHEPAAAAPGPDFGPVRAAPVSFETTLSGQGLGGSYRIGFAHVDEDEVDGSDVLEFTWSSGADSETRTFHLPDLFLRLMFAGNQQLEGRFLTDSTESERDAFLNDLLAKEARALVDDRGYETIRISGAAYEIRLKYLGLRVSLAALNDDPEHLLALICGVLYENDLLEPFVLRVPLRELAGGSTAEFDRRDEVWVQI